MVLIYATLDHRGPDEVTAPRRSLEIFQPVQKSRPTGSKPKSIPFPAPQSAMRAAQSASRRSQERPELSWHVSYFSIGFPFLSGHFIIRSFGLSLSRFVSFSSYFKHFLLFVRSVPACQPRLMMLFAGKFVAMGGSCSGRLTEQDFGGPENTFIHFCQAPAKPAKHHQHLTTSIFLSIDHSSLSTLKACLFSRSPRTGHCQKKKLRGSVRQRKYAGILLKAAPNTNNDEPSRAVPQPGVYLQNAG